MASLLAEIHAEPSAPRPGQITRAADRFARRVRYDDLVLVECGCASFPPELTMISPERRFDFPRREWAAAARQWFILRREAAGYWEIVRQRGYEEAVRVAYFSVHCGGEHVVAITGWACYP